MKILWRQSYLDKIYFTEALPVLNVHVFAVKLEGFCPSDLHFGVLIVTLPSEFL